MIEKEQFCAPPRMELCEAKVGQDRHWSNAWESTNWEGFCGTPWQMVAPELKLTKKGTVDKEGA